MPVGRSKYIIEKHNFRPEFISAFFLIVVSLWVFRLSASAPQQNAIDVLFWSSGFDLGYYSDSSILNKNYYSVKLTGENTQDSAKLSFAKEAIKDFAISGDTLNGVHFHFAPSAKYWTLVKVMELIGSVSEVEVLSVANDVWVFKTGIEPSQLSGCGTGKTSIYLKENKLAID